MDSLTINMDSADSVLDTINSKAVQAIDENSIDSLLVSMDSSSDDSMDSSFTTKQTRLKFKEIEAKIFAVCMIEYKTAAEIAKEIGKSEKYLKNNILPKLLSSEKLTKLHTDNHPNQKYIAKK